MYKKTGAGNEGTRGVDTQAGELRTRLGILEATDPTLKMLPEKILESS
ncbi:MAG: hypothetical protein GY757_26690 [bacterium]|nr:hypothetical protein [bacterium]